MKKIIVVTIVASVATGAFAGWGDIGKVTAGVGAKTTIKAAAAAQEQKETTEKALHKITREATEQVGKASERASEVIDRRIRRDEALWWLRLALTAVPMLLVLLLWVHVGLQM